MKATVKVLVCGVAALSLGGCQSFWADLGLAKRSVSDASVAQTTDNSRLERGREALAAGAPGNAIYHFERAVLDPDAAPDAYNGMGVAYAQLGREDLAERFFNAALMLRPSDPRYARNLARLNVSDIGTSARALARRESEAETMLAQAEADAFAQGLVAPPEEVIEQRGSITIDRRRTSARRTSAQEVVLAGADPLTINAPQLPVERVPSRVTITLGAPGAETREPGEAVEAETGEAPVQISQAQSQAQPQARAEERRWDPYDYTQIACNPVEPANQQASNGYHVRVPLR